MCKRYWVILFILLNLGLNAQIKSVNHSNRIDVIQWNMEWFGDSTYGPSDEKLQFKNALTVIRELNADIYTLCEVSDSLTWLKLLDSLTNYSGIISQWNQKQKVAILFRKDQFKLIYKKLILNSYYTDFASGRLPLEVCLQLSLNGHLDSIYLFAIHLKSNVGTTTQKDDAYNRRLNSANELHSYLANNFANRKVLISGDWNDDFDQSIWNNNITPFLAFNQDKNFTQLTSNLTQNSIGTTASFVDPIDHFVVNNHLLNYWVKDSVFIINPSASINGYSSNTSDHYPIYSGFYINAAARLSHIEKTKPSIYFNGNVWVLNGIENPNERICITDISGRTIFEGYLKQFIPIPSKLYFIQFKSQLYILKYIY